MLQPLPSLWLPCPAPVSLQASCWEWGRQGDCCLFICLLVCLLLDLFACLFICILIYLLQRALEIPGTPPVAVVWIIKVFGICSFSRSCHSTSKLGKTPLPNPLGLLHVGNTADGGSGPVQVTGEICDLWPIVVGQAHRDIPRVLVQVSGSLGCSSPTGIKHHCLCQHTEPCPCPLLHEMELFHPCCPA